MQRLTLSLITSSIVVLAASTNVLASRQYQFFPETPDTFSVAAESAASGQFVSVEHPTTGQVSVVEEDGVRYLEIGQDFQSDRGPALEVILHKSNTVDLKIEEGDYVSLGTLKSFNGAQRYQIPDDLDLSQYQSVAVWCQEFNATFGYAPLPQ